MAFFYALTLFVSATLLFLVQPMIAKMLLPKLGGTPQVWNTCMVFFQAMLLAGYSYAHVATRWFGARTQSKLHLALLVLPLLVWAWVPFGVPDSWEPSAKAHPVVWLLGVLVVTAGLPFFVVSTTAPLLQKWFAETGHPSGRDPYYLYAASNVGSMLALFGYPTLVEPTLTLGEQAWYWGAAYAALGVLIAGCAFLLARSAGPVYALPAEGTHPSAAADRAPTGAERFTWVALGFVPSSLLLGVTTYLTTDIAAFPWLWVLPLALYLLTFILAFSSLGPALESITTLLAPVVVLLFLFQQFTGYSRISDDPGIQTVWLIGYQLLIFFLLALVCHCRLAGLRPSARHLTEFYLWMSLGGVLGGLFNALIVPFLFTSAVEYMLALICVCLLYRPFPADAREPRRLLLDLVLPALVGLLALGLLWWASQRPFDPVDTLDRLLRGALYFVPMLLCYVLATSRRPLRFGLAVAAVVAAALFTEGQRGVLFRARSFFGIVTVKQEQEEGLNKFQHGTTWHGMQSLDPAERKLPLTYFHPSGPMGDIMAVWHARPGQQHLGVTGLGVGTLACYARPGDEVTYYEIDPLVEQVALDKRWFTYLSDAKDRGVKLHILIGDGRMRMREAKDKSFSMIVLDAFSSDAVPVHLLTREALALYRKKLADGGLLVFNISNRHLDLEPVLYHLAKDAKLVGRHCFDVQEKSSKWFSSRWVVLAKEEAHLGAIATSPRWQELTDRRGTSLWTDHYSNLFRVVHWLKRD